jgi:hypothetical protein
MDACRDDPETAFDHWPSAAPDVDRETFNYGRAIGAPDTAEYRAMARYNTALGDVAMVFSNAQWRLEMAVRDIRVACNVPEQEEAMERARVVLHTVDRELEKVEHLPLRFFRYGRIGNVLKQFNPFQ